jgi:hypothetical protein
MSVHERIAQAMQVIAEIDFNKSGVVGINGRDGYNFIPIGQILAAVRRAHAKAGLFLTIGQLEYDKDNGEGIFTQDRWTKARGHCEVSINGADGDCVSFIVPFNVQDNSDKLDNKIVTNIERQAYRVLYAIDEGDATDPETVWQEDKVSAPTEDSFFKSSTKAPKIKGIAVSVTKDKLLRELTEIITKRPGDADIIFTMTGAFGHKILDECSEDELRQILDNVNFAGGA